MSLIKAHPYLKINTKNIIKLVILSLLPRLKRTPIRVKRRGLFREDPTFRGIRKLKEQKEKRNESMNNVPGNLEFLQLTTPQEGVFFQGHKFQILADCKEFRPQDIHCTVTDQYVEIRAANRASETMGMTLKQSASQMCRRFQMPRNINPQLSECYLSADGMLFISGPWEGN